MRSLPRCRRRGRRRASRLRVSTNPARRYNRIGRAPGSWSVQDRSGVSHRAGSRTLHAGDITTTRLHRGVKDAELLVSHQLPTRVTNAWPSRPASGGCQAWWRLELQCRYDPQLPTLRTLHGCGGLLRGIRRWAAVRGRAVTRPWLKSWYQLRKDLGIPPQRASAPCVLGLFSPTAFLGKSSPTRRRPSLPGPSTRCGAAADARPRTPSVSRRRRAAHRLHARLVGRLGRGRLYAVSMAAARALGRRALLLVGQRSCDASPGA